MTSTVPSFTFQTKAQNLAQLYGRLECATVCDVEIITVGEWRHGREACIERIVARFHGAKLIFRSSGTGEDSAETSLAGAFDSLSNVAADSPEKIAEGFATVIQSYSERDLPNIDAQEVLVQPMVPAPILSGVLFTRDLEANSPYYVINYEESDRTDSITGGCAAGHQHLFRIFREVPDDELETPLREILLAARELEAVTAADSLDIEFAMSASGEFFVLQVRPLVQTRVIAHATLDRRIRSELNCLRTFVRQRCQPCPGLLGSTTILGEMPDWNPAEIIGTRPKPLATSLYRHLILDSVWREARGALGYRDPSPHGLLVCLSGHPYIDVRASFNSFLPDELPTELATKLVEHWLAILKEQPESHDKVEFEIVVSCLTFGFARDRKRLSDAGFAEEEIETFRTSLLRLTDSVVRQTGTREADFGERVQSLTERRARLAEAHDTARLPLVVDKLLADCSALGTLPFSIAARCAFIATSLLRSLVSRGALSHEDSTAYLNGIDTIAGEFVVDLDALRSRPQDMEGFLRKYGHLRPGTYDINTPTYREHPEAYLTTAASDAPSTVAPSVAEPLRLVDLVQHGAYAELIAETPFSFTLDELDTFIRHSVADRELLKFEFTKNLSAALDRLAEFGAYHGLSRDAVAFLDIGDVLRFANDSLSGEDVRSLRRAIDDRRKRYELTSAIRLPDLVFSEHDVDIVASQTRRPNFVTQRHVTARAIALTGSSDIPGENELRQKIVLIENADPGYDWLFSKGIAGLCTMYGGAASHMTIRCAEFGLPAAIGCGEQIFSRLREASVISLDCNQEKVEPRG